MRVPPAILSSPSGLYKLKVALNENKNDGGRYNCILLTLYDKNNKEITSFQTGASDIMKWAVDWYRNQDIIIVNSSDIGVYAYHLTDKNKLDKLTVTPDMYLFADDIKKKKYSTD